MTRQFMHQNINLVKEGVRFLWSIAVSLQLDAVLST